MPGPDSPLSRRDFLYRLLGGLPACALGGRLPAVADARCAREQRTGSCGRARVPELVDRLDRRARVARHDPVLHGFDPLSPLSVGNGGFAFTADATGLQTFPEHYRAIPLATEAEWGWHTFPNPAGYRLEQTLVDYDAHGRPVPYVSAQASAAGRWLRENPHRLSLARIGFVLALRNRGAGTNRPVGSDALTDVWQRLDLWSGTLESRFSLSDRRVRVLTRVHPARDLVAVRVELPDLEAGMLAVRIAFPYGSAVHTGDPADWAHPERHTTELARADRTGATWRRLLDRDSYVVRAAWSGGPEAVLRRESEHAFRLDPGPGTRTLDLVVAFARDDAGAEPPPSVDDVGRACADHWQRFWSEGAVVDLDGSRDLRAPELERRIVLSEYLTAIQCAGTLPPQETGETINSWHGKFHLEMHWWHAAHFALWGRASLLERSLPWYGRILPAARATARRQGYRGARWPKMVGPDGRESPSTIGPFLIWQQPHPIYLAELVYRARPGRDVLQVHGEIVSETAEFMASYPVFDAASSRFVLGPPLVPAQEVFPPEHTFNPTFELAYWAWGLEQAQRWRERLGLARQPAWDRVRRGLARLPMRDGRYVAAESAPDTFHDPTQRRDHPSMLGAYGFVPSPAVDREAMRRTLRRVLESWQWDRTWGWDYPLTAMTAARLGEPALAVDALLLDTPRNRYLPNGHNYQRPDLPIYLPGNGGLLAAVAMMAGGWDGAPSTGAPGFPAGWTVRAEGLWSMV